MNALLPQYKRDALEHRRMQLIEEYDAANRRLGQILDAVDAVRIKRQIDDLEQQIQEIDEQLIQPLKTQQPRHVRTESDLQSVRNKIYGVGNHWAILVGVNTYEDTANYGPLRLCIKDVEAIRDQLVAGGFAPAHIRLLTDRTDEKPTRANMLTALKSVADATEPDDLLLFYYSGHGEEVGGESYLTARDGRHLTLSDTAVSISRIKKYMDDAAARAKVIILDACHSGANIGGKGPKSMTAEFINRVFEQAEGMAILASCKQGQLSYESPSIGQGVFTHFLLEALSGKADLDEKGFVTVHDASRHVVNGVKLWASQHNTSQTPTLHYTVAGDIILTRYTKANV